MSVTSPTATTRPADARRSWSAGLDRLRAWHPAPTTATLAIAATGVAYAAASFFARRLTDDGISPVTVAFCRFAIAALALAPFLRFDPKRLAASVWGLGSGAAMAIGWIAYVTAVSEGPIASAGVVYMTSPLFAMLVLATVFDVRPSRRQLLGGVMVVAGASIALGPDGAPVWVSFAAPATFGGATAVLTERLGPLDPFERLGAVAAGAATALLPFLLVQDVAATIPRTMAGWSSIIGLGLGSALLPMLVYAAAAPRVGAAQATIAGTVELPAIFVIGLGFGEALTVAHMLGALVIGAAIVLTSATRPPHAIPGEAVPHPPTEHRPTPSR